MPRVSRDRPENRCPVLKNRRFASKVIVGLVNQKNTATSMSVLMPRANANPRTTPIAKM